MGWDEKGLNIEIVTLDGIWVGLEVNCLERFIGVLKIVLKGCFLLRSEVISA